MGTNPPYPQRRGSEVCRVKSCLQTAQLAVAEPGFELDLPTRAFPPHRANMTDSTEQDAVGKETWGGHRPGAGDSWRGEIPPGGEEEALSNRDLLGQGHTAD